MVHDCGCLDGMDALDRLRLEEASGWLLGGLRGEIRAGSEVTRAGSILSQKGILKAELNLATELRREGLRAANPFMERLGVLLDEKFTMNKTDAEALVNTLAKEYPKYGEAVAALGVPITKKNARSVLAETRKALGQTKMFDGMKPEWGGAVTVRDTRAIDALGRGQAFWIKDYYGTRKIEQARSTIMGALDMGLGRSDTVAMLKERLGDQLVDYKYWDVLASATVGRARSTGCLYSMDEAGFETYQISSAQDEAVCPICERLNGTQFSVQKAIGLIEQSFGLTDPRALKGLMPWIGNDAKGGMYVPGVEGDRDYLGGLNPDALQAKGVGQPPFHGLCRCVTVLVDSYNPRLAGPMRASAPPPGAVNALENVIAKELTAAAVIQRPPVGVPGGIGRAELQTMLNEWPEDMLLEMGIGRMQVNIDLPGQAMGQGNNGAAVVREMFDMPLGPPKMRQNVYIGAQALPADVHLALADAWMRNADRAEVMVNEFTRVAKAAGLPVAGPEQMPAVMRGIMARFIGKRPFPKPIREFLVEKLGIDPIKVTGARQKFAAPAPKNALPAVPPPANAHPVKQPRKPRKPPIVDVPPRFVVPPRPGAVAPPRPVAPAEPVSAGLPVPKQTVGGPMTTTDGALPYDDLHKHLSFKDDDKRLDGIKAGTTPAEARRIQQHIAGGTYGKKERVGGNNVNKAYHLSEGDSTDVMWKPKSGEASLRDEVSAGTYYKREAAAYMLSVHLDAPLIPPTAIAMTGKEIGSRQMWMGEGYETGAMCGAKVKDQIMALSVPAREEWLLLEQLTGNSDRHWKNWMIKMPSSGAGRQAPGGAGFAKLALIDNGLALPTGTGDGWRCPEELADMFCGKPMRAEIKARVDKALAKWVDIESDMVTYGIEQEAVRLLYRKLERMSTTGKYLGKNDDLLGTFWE